MNPYESIWTVDMKVMATQSELNPVYPSQPDLAAGDNFGSCLKPYSVEDLVKCWSLWYLFKLKLGPHWVVTLDNEIKLKM